VLIPLNPQKRPGCYLHRSNPNDVARVEHLTFICTPTKEEAGPTNNWMAPDEAYAKLGALRRLDEGPHDVRGPVRDGPRGSPYAKVGVELTDSVYVVLNMRIMTRMGNQALDMLGDSNDFNRGLHSHPRREPRAPLHLPLPAGQHHLERRLGLRRQRAARQEVPRAAHRQLPRAQDERAGSPSTCSSSASSRPEGETTYVAAAFPSACGKTNFAMMIPPKRFDGWKVWTVGDDIAWMRVGPDGRLWAINPEAGYFGVAPGTNMKSEPQRDGPSVRDTIFTNVALTADGDVWWEGMDGEVPDELTDWQGRPWKKGSTEKAAHPNSRFTAPAANNPALSKFATTRRACPSRPSSSAGAAPPPCRWCCSRSTGPTASTSAPRMGSETTAAATGKVGVVRRDPMAMLPFCGYNMGEYFGTGSRCSAHRQPAEDLPGELVPPGRERQVPVAGLRREHARAQVGRRPRATAASAPGDAPRVGAQGGPPRPLGPRHHHEQVDAATAIDLDEWVEAARRS
jgi:phosphoenolpyruvate carboxykinase (GTP)